MDSTDKPALNEPLLCMQDGLITLAGFLYTCIWRNSDITFKVLVFILIGMDRGDQYLYICGTKNDLTGPICMRVATTPLGKISNQAVFVT